MKRNRRTDLALPQVLSDGALQLVDVAGWIQVLGRLHLEVHLIVLLAVEVIVRVTRGNFVVDLLPQH